MIGSLESEEEDEDTEPATEIHESPEAYAQEISLPPEKADTKITNRPFDDDLEEPSTVELTIASDASNHEQIVHTPPSTMLGQPIGEAAGLAKTVLLPCATEHGN